VSNWRHEQGKSFYFTVGSLAKPVRVSVLHPQAECISQTVEDYVNMIVEERKFKRVSSAKERIETVKRERVARKIERRGSIIRTPSLSSSMIVDPAALKRSTSSSFHH